MLPGDNSKSDQENIDTYQDMTPLDLVDPEAAEYKFLMSEKTLNMAYSYQQALIDGSMTWGQNLEAQFKKAGIKSQAALKDMSIEEFLEHFINTKEPQFFAESDIQGYGRDWNTTELLLLGNISVSDPVYYYDNGVWMNPKVHEKPIPGNLIFIPGALLKETRDGERPDRQQVFSGAMEIKEREDKETGDKYEVFVPKVDREAFYQHYKEKLLPGFINACLEAQQEGKKAFITLPGLGCGVFSGDFRGEIEYELQEVLKRLLREHGNELKNLQGIYFDTNEPTHNVSQSRIKINGIDFMVGPYKQCGIAQLESLEKFNGFGGKEGDHFQDCKAYSVVAWDHASWPGNDIYATPDPEGKNKPKKAGKRWTDDGVKASSTKAPEKFMKEKLQYNPKTNMPDVPKGYVSFEEMIKDKNLSMEVQKKIYVVKNNEVQHVKDVTPTADTKILPTNLTREEGAKRNKEFSQKVGLNMLKACIEKVGIPSVINREGKLTIHFMGMEENDKKIMQATLEKLNIEYKLETLKTDDKSKENDKSEENEEEYNYIVVERADVAGHYDRFIGHFKEAHIAAINESKLAPQQSEPSSSTSKITISMNKSPPRPSSHAPAASSSKVAAPSSSKSPAPSSSKSSALSSLFFKASAPASPARDQTFMYLTQQDLKTLAKDMKPAPKTGAEIFAKLDVKPTQQISVDKQGGWTVKVTNNDAKKINTVLLPRQIITHEMAVAIYKEVDKLKRQDELKGLNNNNETPPSESKMAKALEIVGVDMKTTPLRYKQGGGYFIYVDDKGFAALENIQKAHSPSASHTSQESKPDHVSPGYKH